MCLRLHNLFSESRIKLWDPSLSIVQKLFGGFEKSIKKQVTTWHISWCNIVSKWYSRPSKCWRFSAMSLGPRVSSKRSFISKVRTKHSWYCRGFLFHSYHGYRSLGMANNWLEHFRIRCSLCVWRWLCKKKSGIRENVHASRQIGLGPEGPVFQCVMIWLLEMSEFHKL